MEIKETDEFFYDERPVLVAALLFYQHDLQDRIATLKVWEVTGDSEIERNLWELEDDLRICKKLLKDL